MSVPFSVPLFRPLKGVVPGAWARENGEMEPVQKSSTESFAGTRLGVLENPGFRLAESFFEPLPEDELRLWEGGE